jgi:hypothetical protein
MYALTVEDRGTGDYYFYHLDLLSATYILTIDNLLLYDRIVTSSSLPIQLLYQ